MFADNTKWQRSTLSPDVEFVIPSGTILECFECNELVNNADTLDVHIRRHMTKLYPRECNLDLDAEVECNFKVFSFFSSFFF